MLTRRVLVVFGLLVLSLGPPGRPAFAAGPVITGLTGPASVAQYAKFETTATITPTPTNPYDPAQLDLEGHFTAPSGAQSTVPGFPYQAYVRSQVNGREVLTPSGGLSWNVRFAPTEVGTWSWSWSVATPSGSTSSGVQTLQVTAGTSHGFLRVSPTSNRYLSYNDGSKFLAIGEDVAFPDGPADAGLRTYAYDRVFSSLQAQGANWARIWLAPFGGSFQNGFGLEWNDTGLGNYGGRQDHAWDLDYVVDLAATKGIELQTTFLWHAAYWTPANPNWVAGTSTSDWANNPYNAANGGPLASPGGAFTDATAQAFQRRLFRYILARWGYATSIGTWELWNEVGYVDGYTPSTSASWHSSMAAYLRSLDPAHRPVTTSLGSIGNNQQDPGLWANAGLDVSQVHKYATSLTCGSCNWPLTLRSAVVAARAADAVPTLVAEESISHGTAGGSGMTSTDAKGIGFHDGLWAPLLSGAYGTGMSWWWLAVDNNGSAYYPHLGALARFVAPIRLDQEALTSDVVTETPIPTTTLDRYGLHGSHVAIYWLKDRAYQYDQKAAAPVANGTVTLPTSATGHWCGTWWDTWAGTATTAVASTASGTVLTAPVFQGDTALRLTAC